MSSTKTPLLLAILAGLLLGGCATAPEESTPDFQMPESVTVDLNGEVPTPVKDQPATETAADSGMATDSADKKPAATDQDSAAVLDRLKNQQAPAPIVARDPEHEKQAQKAKPEFERALTEMKKGNLDGALAQFRQISGKYPLLAGPIVNQAIILRKKGQLEAAHKLLQDALLTHARNPYLLNELGVASRELGQFKKAQVSYETAIRIDVNYAKAHYNLAVLADLYLHDPRLALQEFNTYQSLVSAPDPKVAGWIKELERRIAKSNK